MNAEDRLPRLVAIGLLTKVFPPDLVDDVVDHAGAREQRERVLPARLTVYFTLALWLFVNSGYECVMARLAEGLYCVRRTLGDREVPRASSLARARDRLGPDALHLLFERVAGPVGTPDTHGAFWRGHRLVSWSGATLDVPDTPANDHAWGRPAARSSPHEPPRVRLFALAECGTQALINATFGPYGMGEPHLARRLLRYLKPGMVLLADFRPVDQDLWAAARETGADLVWRIPSDRLPIGQPLPDGTYLATIDPEHSGRSGSATARVIDYTITGERLEPEPYSLATTLTDPEAAPRSEVARLYRARWELLATIGAFAAELDELPKLTLRSTKPDGIAQEIWAMFCVHHAIRDFIGQGAGPGEFARTKISFNGR